MGKRIIPLRASHADRLVVDAEEHALANVATWEFLKFLDPTDRAIVAGLWGGESLGEIGERLDIDPRWVGRRRARIRRKLRAYLAA
jgi:DNA-directed RNA polymerase specialized sigma24 family protein